MLYCHLGQVALLHVLGGHKGSLSCLAELRQAFVSPLLTPLPHFVAGIGFKWVIPRLPLEPSSVRKESPPPPCFPHLLTSAFTLYASH